jgi:hypothetical protein
LMFGFMVAHAIVGGHKCHWGTHNRR